MIDEMLRQAQNQQSVDIVSYLHAIREDRPYMVQTIVRHVQKLTEFLIHTR
jgi:hypothetical protein